MLNSASPALTNPSRALVLPRDLARTAVRHIPAAELAAIVQEAVTILNGGVTPMPMPNLDKLAAKMAADTDLGMFAARDALRHAAIREAALRFVASVTGDRAD